MVDSTLPGPSGSSVYESTSNEVDISSDESLSSNKEESSSSVSNDLVTWQERGKLLVIHQKE